MSLSVLPWNNESPRSVASRVASTVARSIVEGRLEPGSLLTEVALAEEYGVSRTPVREALLQLETWGLVRLLPKKGALVTTTSTEERRDLLDVRTTWEIRAVEVIGQDPDARAALIATLRETLERQLLALQQNDPLDFAAEDFAFHLRTIEAGGNRVVAELLSGLGPRFARLTYQAAADGPTAIHRFRDEHERLIERIEAGDPSGFATTIRAHIEAAHFPRDAR